VNKAKQWLGNTAFFFCILLTFLLVFEQFMRLPLGLQVLGRMHPLVLHFPITLASLGAFGLLLPARFSLFSWAKQPEFWYFSAVMTALTALCGLFLSREGGYDAGTLAWHKYSGAALALLCGLLAWRLERGTIGSLGKILGIFSLVLTLICGHKGGVLTHGDNFLLEPISPKSVPVAVANNKDALLYENGVKPILEAKCFSCHNPKKTKGGLLMSSLEGLRKGGETGPVFLAGNPDSSQLFALPMLPEEHDRHMPPRGKTQLSPNELKLIHFWIKKGASFSTKIAAFKDNDTLSFLQKPNVAMAEVLPQVAAASDKNIQTAQSVFCNIRPFFQDNNYLEAVVLDHPKYQASVFVKLDKLNAQLYRLECNGAPVTDAELKAIGKLKTLRELGLGSTKIKGENLAELKGLKNLRLLKVHGNQLPAKSIEPLLALPALQKIYVWGNKIDDKTAATWAKRYKKIQFNFGTLPDTAVLKLNMPKAEKPQAFFNGKTTLDLRHPMRGVRVWYTTDGRNPDPKAKIGQLYTQPLSITKDSKVKFMAELDNWHNSDVDSFEFHVNSFQPIAQRFLQPIDRKYHGGGDSVIFDLKKGPPSHTVIDGWLGFVSPSFLDVECDLAKQQRISKVTVCALAMDYASILPPSYIEVMAATEPGKWKKVGQLSIPVPTSGQYGSRFYECTITPGQYSSLRIVAKPVAKLPAWHGNKGNPGWVFVDEILLN
jgi:hypothetical protein